MAAFGLILTATLLPAQSPNESEKVPTPFGLHMGMKKDKIGRIEMEVSQHKYQLTSVSKPHPDLEIYVATVTPNAGLCFIRALSHTWQTKREGTELQAKFQDVKSQIEEIYGKAHITDSLAPGSTRTRSRDWMATLLDKERTLLARWSAADDNLPMKPTIAKIYVGAYALAPNQGYLVVEYYFTNYAECQTEISPAGAATPKQ
jgi:hypothetical protein